MSAAPVIPFDLPTTITTELRFPAFPCGCVPFVSAFSYAGWLQYGSQVRRGQRAQRIEGEGDRLFCACQVTELKPRPKRIATPAPVPAAPPVVPEVAPPVADPAPMTSMSANERELYETAQRVAARVESSLLDDMLATPRSAPAPKPDPVPAPVAKPAPQGAPLAELMARLA